MVQIVCHRRYSGKPCILVHAMSLLGLCFRMRLRSSPGDALNKVLLGGTMVHDLKNNLPRRLVVLNELSALPTPSVESNKSCDLWYVSSSLSCK